MEDKKLKLAIITDIHKGPDNFTKIGSQASELLSGFIQQVNESDVDMVIELGDRISDVDRETDRKNLKAVAALFSQLNKPRYHLLGNHDRVNLEREDNEEILQSTMHSSYLDTGLFRLVMWRPAVKIRQGSGFPILSEDLDWLEETLSSTDKKVLIFNHVPVSGHPQFGNYYFHNNFEHSTYPGYERILDLAGRHLNTCCWISGHVHWNTYINITGIPMLTLQSLTESFTTLPDPCGGWAEVEITANRISCRINGIDPLQLHAPLIDRTTASWHSPLGRFSEEDIKG